MNKLKELRKEKKLTLRELSHNTGISFGALGNYEKERREPSHETWQKLADFFGVSVLYLQGKAKTLEQTELDLQYLKDTVKINYSEINVLDKQLGDELSQLAINNDAKDEVSRVYDELIKLLDGYNNDFDEAVKTAQEAIQQYQLEQLQNEHPES